MCRILCMYRIKLNLLKCAFGVAYGKFFSYMVNQRGIKANPKKIKAFIGMQSPSSPKEVQSLTRRLAILNQFISKATNCFQPFFRTIKREKHFEWTKKLRTPSGNSKPGLEELLCYPSLRMKKCYLFTWRYQTSRQFDISYKPRSSVKKHTLEDFVAVLAHIPEGLFVAQPQKVPTWKLYVDESLGKAGARVQILLISLDENNLNCVLRLEFRALNNTAEYKALLAGLKLA
ncbi:Retrovirus-related Pol polyprotein from transposon [Abeliophyllum distichum]|uniref:Retrovirus-related Pol polyprotein from transposon n=1 Tax=Abeliophyllum distichum TaxID=126358 RepID=A0ABD1VWL6_9LAMI